MYYIDKKFLGTKEHIFPTTKSTLGLLAVNGTDQPGTMQSFARIMNAQIKILPEEIENSLVQCKIPLSLAGLSHLVSEDRFKQIIADFDVSVSSKLAEIFDYYPQYVSNVKVLNSCVQLLLHDNDKGSKAGSGSVSEKILYDTTTTKTGRMSVISGPNVLTMQKQFKNRLISRFSGGYVVEVDYSALEPRTALAIAGSDLAASPDVYSVIGQQLGILDRDIAKQVIISFLYGAAISTISRVANISKEILAPKLRELKQLFSYDTIVGDINNQLSKNGYFKNDAGRVIFPTSDKPGTLFNNYCQSTAVDAALSGFSNMLKEFQEKGMKSVPLCFIHDAVILDVPKEELQIVMDVVKTLPIYLGVDFPTKLNVLNK